MKEQSLKFLYSRLKRPELTKEQTESKVCQEIFIAKIGNNQEIAKKIAFKGGLIIDSLSHGQRGFTKDIDFDFIKYPLSDDGLSLFISKLNSVEPYLNVQIQIAGIDELRHKNYHGKRLNLTFSDNESCFNLIVDVGIYLPLIKKNIDIEYVIAFDKPVKILANPIERMIVEKLSTFAIYGLDNSRDKDLFDAYFLIINYSFDKKIIKKMFIKSLVSRTHYYKNLQLAFETIHKTISNKKYQLQLNVSKRNWISDPIEIVVTAVNKFLQSIIDE